MSVMRRRQAEITRLKQRVEDEATSAGIFRDQRDAAAADAERLRAQIEAMEAMHLTIVLPDARRGAAS